MPVAGFVGLEVFQMMFTIIVIPQIYGTRLTKIAFVYVGSVTTKYMNTFSME